MNWKRLLQSNLTQVFSKAPDPEGVPTTPRYFWSFVLDLFRPRAEAPFETEATLPYPDSVARRACDPRWRGPMYWGGRAWRQDVLIVSEYMRSLVASNAPLAAGMAAAAREECRKRYRWTPQRITRLASIALLGFMAMLIGGGIMLDSNGIGGLSGIVQMVVLVVIGLWLIRLVLLTRNNRLAVFLALEARLASGSCLSDAMTSLPRFFPRHLADLVAVGEETGNLDGAFAQFNDSMLSALNMHRHLQGVFRYFSLVVTIQFLLLAFLAVKALPVFDEITTEIYENHSDAPLPSYMGTLDTVTEFTWYFGNHWPKAAVVFALIVLWRMVRRYRGRHSWNTGSTASLILVVPWFRGLIVRHNLGLIALMLHGLLRSGVPMDRALALCSGTDLHPAYRDWLSGLRESLRGGASLRESLAQTGRRRLIPDSFTGQLEAGEFAGQLPAMLERIAGLYRRDVDKQMQILVATVLPLGILFLGYITMFTYTLGFRLIIGLADAMIV